MSSRQAKAAHDENKTSGRVLNSKKSHGKGTMEGPPAIDDSLAWHPWNVCSQIKKEIPGQLTQLDLLEVIKEIMKAQHKRTMEQILTSFQTNDERIDRSMAAMLLQNQEFQKNQEEFQKKQEGLHQKSERLIRDLFRRLDTQWYCEEDYAKQSATVSTNAADGLAQYQHQKTSAETRDVLKPQLIVTGQVMDQMPVVKESHVSIEKKVPVAQEIARSADSLSSRSRATNFAVKVASRVVRFVTPNQTPRNNEGHAFEQTGSTQNTKTPDAKEDIQPAPRKSRKSIAFKKKKRKLKEKELKLERDDDDITLFLVADKIDMEAKVEQELDKLNMSETWKRRLLPTEGRVARCVSSWLFPATVNLVIIFNVAAIALQSEKLISLARDGDEPSAMFQLVDTFFCVFFFIEISLRLFAERIVFFIGPEWRYNVLDFSFVVGDAANQVLSYALHGVNLSYVSSLRTGMKMIRLARAAQALRMFRIVRNSTRARILIEETISSMSLGFWICTILWVMLTFFGIFFMQATADSLLKKGSSQTLQDKLLHNFGSSPEAVLSLFKIISGGLPWSPMFRDLVDVDPVYGVVFITFIVFTVLLFLNVATSVFVDSALQRSKMQQIENKSEEAELIRNMLRKAHLENSEGTVSKQEFLDFLTTPYGNEQLTMLGLESAEALGIYELLDKNGNHNVNIDELSSALSRFTQPVRSADNVALLLAVKKVTKEQRAFATYVQNQFRAMIEMFEVSILE